jgi:hypothetical protein
VAAPAHHPATTTAAHDARDATKREASKAVYTERDKVPAPAPAALLLRRCAAVISVTLLPITLGLAPRNHDVIFQRREKRLAAAQSSAMAHEVTLASPAAPPCWSRWLSISAVLSMPAQRGRAGCRRRTRRCPPAPARASG